MYLDFGETHCKASIHANAKRIKLFIFTIRLSQYGNMVDAGDYIILCSQLNTFPPSNVCLNLFLIPLTTHVHGRPYLIAVVLVVFNN